MNYQDLDIHLMSPAELQLAVDWAASEGWNPGLHDVDAFYATDPEGYYIGLLNGAMVGSVSAVKYSADFAFMGFFIVAPELRGGSLGPQLAEHALEHIQGATAGLDAVLEQAERYAGIWGFETAYHNMRYEGVAAIQGATDPNITPYTSADLAAVERYDRACFPAPRHVFLERWLVQPEAHAFVAREGNAVTGYGVIRPAHTGHRIGPLFADTPADADALFDALVSRVPEGAPVFIDIPGPNAAALNLVSQRRMTPMFETARMYRGGTPDVALDKVFGVTTLELG
jgi:GNAT superfamily N-acetyltransferase